MSSALAVGALLAVCAAAYVSERQRRATRPMSPGPHPEIHIAHEREFELYHNAFSFGSKQVRVALGELGVEPLAHAVATIEIGAYENLSADFLAVNPAGLLPVLVHRGQPVYGAREILHYAAAHAPPGAPALVPPDPARARRMSEWLDRASLFGDDPAAHATRSAGGAVMGVGLPLLAAMLETVPLARIFEGVLFHRLKSRPLSALALKRSGVARLPRLGPAMKSMRDCAGHLKAHLDALERELAGGGPWITGDAFGLADAAWIAVLERLREADALGLFLAPRLALAAWWERVGARPSYRRALAEQLAPAAAAGLERLRAAKRADPALREALEGPCR